MRYGEVLKRALQLTWQNKVMWIFGIALALFGGSAQSCGNPNVFNYSFNNTDIERFRRGTPPMMPGTPFDSWLRGLAANWEGIVAALLGILIILALIGLVLFILGIIVRYTSVGALISMVDELESTGETGFRSGLRGGWGHLIRLFLIGLIIGIANAIVSFVIVVAFILGALLLALPAIAMFSGGEGGWIALGVIWLIGVGLGMVALGILVGLIVSAVFTLTRVYAFRYAVLEESGVFDSIGSGFGLLRSELKSSIVTWIILGLIELAVGIVSVPVVLVISLAALIPGFLIYGLTESFLLAILLAAPILLIAALVAIVIEGIYLTFRSTSWTLAFFRLRPPALEA